MADDSGAGVSPPPVGPPETRLLDSRISAMLAERGGGGGGGSDQLTPRVAKVEAEVTAIAETLRDIKETLRTINASMGDVQQRMARTETDIKHLPSKSFIVTATILALAFFGAILLFQHQVQQAIGVAPIGK